MNVDIDPQRLEIFRDRRSNRLYKGRNRDQNETHLSVFLFKRQLTAA